MEIGTAQVAVRRRALGRRFVQLGLQISNMRGNLNSSADLQFLTEAERKAYDKQMEGLGKILGNLQKLGYKLEEGK